MQEMKMETIPMSGPEDLSPTRIKEEIQDRTSSDEEAVGGVKCGVCGVLARSHHQLTLHLRSHNRESPTKCSLCGKVLGSPSSLDRHLLVHSGERPFSCSLCGLTFTTNGNMHRHMRSHEQDGGGGHGPKRKVEWNNNETEDGEGGGTGEEDEEPEGRKKAKRGGRRGGRLGCPKCDRAFVSSHVLQSHLEEEHPECSASCLQCNLVFKNYRVLNLHKFMVHYSEEDQARDLSLVDFSSPKFPLIARAMLARRGSPPSASPPRQDHEGDDPKYDFLARLDLRKSPEKAEDSPSTEENRGSPDPEPPQEEDSWSWELRRMKLRGEFPCRLCPVVLPNLRALKGHNRVHLQSSAGGGGPLLCNMCPYRGQDKAAVVRHMRCHNGDRPYQCSLCAYAFTTKANCERHLRNRHAATRHDLKNSIIYHPTEDPSNEASGQLKEDVKRSLFPDESADEEPRKEVGTMTVESEGPLDLSMDALDLTTRKKAEEEEAPGQRRAPPPPLSVPKLHLGYFAPPPLPPPPPPYFPRYPQSALPPYFVPAPTATQAFLVAQDTLKERIQEELIRSLGLGRGQTGERGEEGEMLRVVQQQQEVAAAAAAAPKKVEPPGVKMVIKNGVLVPKQKQRRYRTERPFACDHCTARFTLRSNMERHVKQQHPQLWSTRQRGGSGGKKAAATTPSKSAPPPPQPTPNSQDTKISQGVRQAIVEQLRSKVSGGGGGGGRPSQDESSATKEDLASVSKLLDNANSQTFYHYFQNMEEGGGPGPHEASDEEGLVASHSEENSGSDENRSESEVTRKKASAYSLAPHRVSCPYCHRKFPWSSSLRRHVLTHTGQKPFKCPACPLLFTTKSNCDRHLLRKHGGVTPSAPPSSSSASSSPGEPEAAPRNVPERPYKCARCPSSTFSTLGNLKKHACSKHEEEEEQEVGGRLEGAGSEAAAGGGGELPFKCHLCEAAFGERQDALDHLGEAHTREYAALVNKGALESSAEEVEEADDSQGQRNRFPDYTNRKVMCAFCLRRFWSAEDLRRHMRTHTGERPFSCDVCTRRFTLKHSMLRHRKKHNNNNNNNNTCGGASLNKESAGGSEAGTDLIGNLLGIGDSSVVDSMLEKSADDAAKLLGVQGEGVK